MISTIYSAQLSFEEKLKNIALEETLHSLKSGNLSAFDALVGECACQVRAVKIASLYNKYKAFGQEGLSEQDLEFLILSYILTAAKGKRGDSSPTKRSIDYKNKFTIHEETSYKHLQKISTERLFYKPATAAIQNAQRRLAELSVHYLQELAKDSVDKDLAVALKYTLFDREETCLRREHCGYYPSMKILLEEIIKEGCVVGMYVHPITDDSQLYKFYFRPLAGVLTPIERSDIKPQEPIIIVQGYSNLITDKDQEQTLKDALPKIGIENIILANFAAHPQFAGNQKNADIPYTELGIQNLLEEKNHFVQLAQAHGCQLDNIGAFFLNHIYSTTNTYL